MRNILFILLLFSLPGYGQFMMVTGGGPDTQTSDSDSSLLDPGKGTFDSGTESWIAAGNNPMSNDDGALKITYFDNSAGATCDLSATSDLITNLTVGAAYKIYARAKVNEGSSVELRVSGPNINFGTVNSTEYAWYSGNFIANHATDDNFRLTSFGTDEIIWIDQWVLIVSPDTVVYYVDADKLDDSGNGLTTGTAWKTLQHANDNIVTGSNPVVIALQPGDTWSDATSVQINNGGVEGNAVVWDGNYYLWGGGADAIIQSSDDPAGTNAAKVHIYATSYVTLKNITIDGNNTQTHGIAIGGNPDVFGGTQDSENNIIIEDCIVQDCGDDSDYRIGILVRPFTTSQTDITIQRNTVTGVSSHGIAFYPQVEEYTETTAQSISDSYIGYNTISDYRGWTGNTGVGIMLINTMDNVIVEHNEITRGVAENGVACIAIDRNETASGPYCSTNLIVRYNTLKVLHTTTTDVAMIIQNAYTTPQVSPITAKIYGNIIYNASTSLTGSAGTLTVNPNTPSTLNGLIEFYFNTIIGPNRFTIRLDTETASSVVFKNNIVYNGYDGGDFDGICLTIDTEGTTDHSNNVYYKPNTAYLVDYAGSYKKAAATVTWEPTCVVTDPTFTVEFTNLHYQTGSPVDGAGITISGITTDMEDTEMTEPPDIGALHSIEDP